MLGRNHAVYGLAGWMAAWPAVSSPQAAAMLHLDPGVATFGVTCAVAAGASVIPDLDHPDSRPSAHFGIVSKMVARGVSQAAGGHRMATHSALFAVLLGAVTFAVAYAPLSVGRWIAAVACGFCCSVGLALVGPSMGFRVSSWASLVFALGTGWWVWSRYEDLAFVLPVIAAYGVIVHIACDMVTRGGVPLFWPFSRRRIALGLFAVGGPGERVASFIGFVLLALASWHAVRTLAA